jgi:flagellar hook assembly protein FlgD
MSVNGAVGKLTGISGLNDASWSVYPNPVNDLTTLSFVLPATGNVEIGIWDQTGNQVAQVINGNLQAGSHQVNWNGTGHNGQRLSAGVYYCRYTAGGQTSVKKLVILP